MKKMLFLCLVLLSLNSPSYGYGRGADLEPLQKVYEKVYRGAFNNYTYYSLEWDSYDSACIEKEKEANGILGGFHSEEDKVYSNKCKYLIAAEEQYDKGSCKSKSRVRQEEGSLLSRYYEKEELKSTYDCKCMLVIKGAKGSGRNYELRYLADYEKCQQKLDL